MLQVAKNEIWREAIRKETKHLGGDSEFTINPSKRELSYHSDILCDLLIWAGVSVFLRAKSQ